MSVSGNGQSDPSFKREGGKRALIGTGGRAAGICFAKNSWKSSVGPVKGYFEGRLGISGRAVERDDEKFLLVKGSEGKYQLTEARAKWGFFSYFLTE